MLSMYPSSGQEIHTVEKKTQNKIMQERAKGRLKNNPMQIFAHSKSSGKTYKPLQQHYSPREVSQVNSESFQLSDFR